MRGKTIWASLSITSIAATAFAATPQPVQKDDISAGARDYRAYGCAACHGTTGAGGGWQGPRVAPDPMPIEAFVAQLREPADKMPRYRANLLTDRQVANIHAYLRSIRSDKAARDIDLLQR